MLSLYHCAEFLSFSARNSFRLELFQILFKKSYIRAAMIDLEIKLKLNHQFFQKDFIIKIEGWKIAIFKPKQDSPSESLCS